MASESRHPACLVVLDKPAGPTSFDLVKQIRRASRCRRVGHGGTLDPFATGVLVVAVGAATRLLTFMSEGSKRYRLWVEFGRSTDSCDATGETEAEGEVAFDREALERVLPEYVGEIQQVPPSLSAIRVDGERAYALHRRGEHVVLPARPVTVRSIDLVAWQSPRAELVVDCGGGTYMRSLARDLGERLGCPAHAAELRREAVGPFTLADSGAPGEVADNWSEHPAILPPVSMARHWPTLVLDGDQVRAVRAGIQPDPAWALEWSRLPPLSALVDGRGRLVAVARADDSKWRLAMVLPPDAGVAGENL